jgi:NDP-sugar pyrophosphorylase family protein
MTMDPNLIILAGGISSRMKRGSSEGLEPHLAAVASTGAKGMLGVGTGNRPFLDYLLHNARASGYRDVVIVVGEENAPFREHYGMLDRGNEFHGLRISYAVQPIPPDRTRPLGTADAVERALRSRPDWNGAHVTVCNSDNLYSVKVLRALLEEPTGSALIDYDRAALRFPPERVEQFGVLVKDREGTLVDIIEKPSPEELERARDATGRLGVSMNIWRFPADRILRCVEELPLHPLRQEKELPLAALLMIRHWPGSLRTIPAAEHVLDLTSRTDIRDVQAALAREFRGALFDR